MGPGYIGRIVSFWIERWCDNVLCLQLNCEPKINLPKTLYDRVHRGLAPQGAEMYGRAHALQALKVACPRGWCLRKG